MWAEDASVLIILAGVPSLILHAVAVTYGSHAAPIVTTTSADTGNMREKSDHALLMHSAVTLEIVTSPGTKDVQRVSKYIFDLSIMIPPFYF